MAHGWGLAGRLKLGVTARIFGVRCFITTFLTFCCDEASGTIIHSKKPLQFPGEGVSHDPHLQENGLWFDDPLESVGLGGREAVEAFEGDEDFVGAGVGEAEVAEGHARGGIGDGTGLLVVGDRLEVAHGHRDGAGMGGKTDELFRVFRKPPQRGGHGLQRFGLDQPFAVLQEERVHAPVGGVNAAGTE